MAIKRVSLLLPVQLLRKWESRERKKARDYEKEKEREKERKTDETKEARRLKEFFEDYDDERDDVKFYKCVHSCWRDSQRSVDSFTLALGVLGNITSSILQGCTRMS